MWPSLDIHIEFTNIEVKCALYTHACICIDIFYNCNITKYLIMYDEYTHVHAFYIGIKRIIYIINLREIHCI